tara:strand:- start:748 stop:1005 length:258 start_codon:yes stop_codon:yes gene_type:complete
MEKTAVKYTKGKAVITMPIENYGKMCRYFNVFNEAMNEIGETMDFRLSELQSMDYLRYSLLHNLGFEKVKESYYTEYKIPDGSKK